MRSSGPEHGDLDLERVDVASSSGRPRGSRSAAARAFSATSSTSGRCGSSVPMHPCSAPPGWCSETKAPPTCSYAAPTGATAGEPPRASRTHARAYRASDQRVVARRHDVFKPAPSGAMARGQDAGQSASTSAACEAGANRAIDLSHASVRADQIRDTAARRARRPCRGTDRQREVRSRSEKQTERKLLGLDEGGVRFRRVEGHADDLDAALSEVVDAVAKPASLGGAAGRLRLRIETRGDRSCRARSFDDTVLPVWSVSAQSGNCAPRSSSAAAVCRAREPERQADRDRHSPPHVASVPGACR
jgi:hypothetical protein